MGKFPVNVSDINKFENQNSSISVNITKILRKLLSYNKQVQLRESPVNLLLISDDTK